ncbi:unnamed protein product [Camellia sinensis]
MPILDLILQFERSCRNVSESIRTSRRSDADHTAQLGLRIVQWLEVSASKILDLDNEGDTSELEAYTLQEAPPAKGSAW